MTVLNLVRRRRDGGTGAGHLDDVSKRHAAGRLLGSPHVATNAEAHDGDRANDARHNNPDNGADRHAIAVGVHQGRGRGKG